MEDTTFIVRDDFAGAGYIEPVVKLEYSSEAHESFESEYDHRCWGGRSKRPYRTFRQNNVRIRLKEVKPPKRSVAGYVAKLKDPEDASFFNERTNGAVLDIVNLVSLLAERGLRLATGDQVKSEAPKWQRIA